MYIQKTWTLDKLSPVTRQLRDKFRALTIEVVMAIGIHGGGEWLAAVEKVKTKSINTEHRKLICSKQTCQKQTGVATVIHTFKWA